MSTHKFILRSSATVSLGTLSSRILGFIRDMVFARIFGVYALAQAFVIAFKIPNLLRDFLGEGAANAAIVPVFTEYKTKHTQEEFWELANIVLNLLLVAVSAVTILGIIFAPIIVRLIAPGFTVLPEKLEVTIRLSRIIFPYILLISLAAYVAGLLNTLKHFSVPSFAPCLLNISIIIFAMLFGENITGLATGVLVGGLLQLLIQIPVLYKKGFKLKLFRRFKHPEAKTIGILMIPRLFSTGIYQLNNFVDSIFGSLSFIVGEGGIAILYFAYRLIQFPIGIFSNALSQVVLPSFSTQALEEDRGKLKNTLSFSLRAIIFVMLPASIGFMVLGRTIIRALFEGGKFDVHSTILTSEVLFFYSIGLFAYGANKILNSCFFSLKDTKTPAKISLFALICNIALNSILMFPMKLNGLALATSISGITTCLLQIFILKNRIGDFHLKEIGVSFSRILCASLAMGMMCHFLMQNIYIGNSFISKASSLILLLLGGVASYVIFCFIFGVKEMRDLWNWLAQRAKS